MRALRILLEKEFRQIFRNPAILRLMFMVPTIQLLVLPQAADFEVKHVNVCVVDYDRSPYSKRLVNKVTATDYFQLVDYDDSYDKALRYLARDQADVVLQIPEGFERTLVKENSTTVFLAVNAVNGVKANLGGAYLRSVIADFSGEVRVDWIQPQGMNAQPMIGVDAINWYTR